MVIPLFTILVGVWRGRFLPIFSKKIINCKCNWKIVVNSHRFSKYLPTKCIYNIFPPFAAQGWIEVGCMGKLCYIIPRSIEMVYWILLTPRRRIGKEETTRMCCPCADCKNENMLDSIVDVHAHLIQRAFMKGYTCWVKHGEQQSGSGAQNQ